jgi:hypothetical protein
VVVDKDKPEICPLLWVLHCIMHKGIEKAGRNYTLHVLPTLSGQISLGKWTEGQKRRLSHEIRTGTCESHEGKNLIMVTQH